MRAGRGLFHSRTRGRRRRGRRRGPPLKRVWIYGVVPGAGCPDVVQEAPGHAGHGEGEYHHEQGCEEESGPVEEDGWEKEIDHDQGGEEHYPTGVGLKEGEGPGVHGYNWFGRFISVSCENICATLVPERGSGITLLYSGKSGRKNLYKPSKTLFTLRVPDATGWE